MARELACTLLCQQCRAPLPLELSGGPLRCAHCDAIQEVDRQKLAQARAHVDRLNALVARGSALLSDAAYYRRLSGFWRGHLITAVIIGSLTAGAVLLYLASEALTPLLGETGTQIVFVPLCAVVLLGILFLLLKWLSWSRRVRATLKPVRVAEATCGNCGATMPVILGEALQCPFCDAELLAGATSRQRAESAAREQVDELEQETERARREFLK